MIKLNTPTFSPFGVHLYVVLIDMIANLFALVPSAVVFWNWLGHNVYL